MTALLLAVVLAAPPEGLVKIESQCASGGDDYFFFPSGVVIAECWGCTDQPLIREGSWKLDGKKVVVEMKTEWAGVGQGKVVEAASVDVFGAYAAVRRPSKERAEFELAAFTASDDEQSCGHVKKHDRSANVRTFLRLFLGEHPETFQRELTPFDLSKLKKNELRLMRNEIYARYGFVFKDAELKKHFAAVPGYRARLTDVDAFLSDVEKSNLETLKAAEAKAK
ncbi:MAG: YARHG domain-containing protein [Archangium sp.]